MLGARHGGLSDRIYEEYPRGMNQPIKQTISNFLYTRCSDVIDVIVITRLHVGGIPGVNRKQSQMRKAKNFYANVIRRLVFFD